VNVGPLVHVEKTEPVTPPPVVSQPNPNPAFVPTDQGPKMPTMKWVAIGTASAGALALIAGTIKAVSAKSTWNDAKALGCDDMGVCRPQAGVDKVNDASSAATLSTVLLVGGVALVGGGAALWFLTPERETTGVHASVSAGPTGVQLGMKGSF